MDPSSELDFRSCHALRHELFRPIVEGIPKAFVYGGPARDHFMRAIHEQIEIFAPENTARTLGLDHLWRAITKGEGAPAPIPLETDTAFAAFSRAAREKVLGEATRVGRSRATRGQKRPATPPPPTPTYGCQETAFVELAEPVAAADSFGAVNQSTAPAATPTAPTTKPTVESVPMVL